MCRCAAARHGIRRAGVYADVKTRNKTQIKFEGMLGRMVGMFGGKAAKEGVDLDAAPSRAIARSTMTDTTGRIVDLAEEKVYEIDLKKKTYTVMTFAELRQQHARRRRRRRSARPTRRRRSSRQGEAEEQEKPDTKDVEVDFDVKETGQKKPIAGYDAREVGDDDHRAREGQDARGQRRPGHDLRHVAGARRFRR